MISNPWMLAAYWEKRVTIGTFVLPAYSLLLPADSSRIAIIFSAQKGNLGAINLSPQTLSTTGFGIQLNGGDPPLMIDMQSFGGLTTYEWYISVTGGNANLTVIESFYRPYIRDVGEDVKLAE